jgi:hypothetical protein
MRTLEGQRISVAVCARPPNVVRQLCGRPQATGSGNEPQRIGRSKALCATRACRSQDVASSVFVRQYYGTVVEVLSAAKHQPNC